MSSFTYPQYGYQPEDDYVFESTPIDEYGFPTLPSSFGHGGHAMTATSSSQSTSSYDASPSYTASPSSWEWQQPRQYLTYNSLSTTPEAYLAAQTEDPAYPPQTQSYRPAPEPQQAQERPRSQRSTTGSGPNSSLVCLITGCPSDGGCFKRMADLTRHIDTVHDVKRRWPCPRPRCNRKADLGFTRRDHLYEHLRNTHGIVVPTGGSEGGDRGGGARGRRVDGVGRK